jgi:hypothetical protein
MHSDSFSSLFITDARSPHSLASDPSSHLTADNGIGYIHSSNLRFVLNAGNQIGDAGAAAVASALEPRRNGDGSWTPSTALTVLALNGEWVLILMVVIEEE